MTSERAAERIHAGEAIAPRATNGDRSTRVAITVLGMHRSGTSAAARTLSLLGADLPTNLMPAWEGNEPGHWEPEHIVALNDEVLADASTSWDDVARFPATWYGSGSEHGFRRQLVDLLADEYGSSPLFVVKDPRLCRLIPFWLGAVAEYGATASFLITVRNPLEVAASLKARDGFSFPKGLLLWLRNMIDVERDTRGHPRAFLSYGRLLDDWEREIRAVSPQLGVDWPKLNHRTRVEIETFLGAEHRHHSASAWDLKAHTAAVSWVSRAYETLERAAAEGEAPSAERLDEVGTVLDEADAAYGPLLAEAGLARQEAARELERSRGEFEGRGKELDMARAELQARSSAIDELRRQLGALEQERAGQRDQIAALEVERERLRGEIAERGAEAERLKASVDQHSSALTSRLQELERGQHELESVRARLSERSAEIESLQARLEERDRLLRERDPGRRIEEQDAELGARAAEIESLQAQLGDSERRLSQRDQRLSELHRSLNERDDRLTELDRSLSERDDRLNERMAELERARSEAAARASAAANRRRALEQREREAAELREQLQRHGAEDKRLRGQLERLRGETERLSDELERRQQAVAAATEERADAVAERDRLREEQAHSVRERNRLAADLQARVWEAEQLRSHIALVEGEVERAQAAIESVRAETALTYLNATKASKWRSAAKLLSWVLPLPRATGRRYVRTFLALRRSDAFDYGFYLTRYTDVAVSGENALMHYIEHGVEDGRDPSPGFSTWQYLERHPDVAESGENPLLHHLNERNRDPAGEGPGR